MIILLYTLILVYLVPLLLSVHIMSSLPMQSNCETLSRFFKLKSSNNNYSIYISIICVSGIFSETMIKKLFSKFSSFTSIYLVLVFFFSAHSATIYSFSNCNHLVNSVRNSFHMTSSAIKSCVFTAVFRIASLLLFLIVISNISLLNPGPAMNDILYCYFHNIQGFITLNSIGKDYRNLNITKLIEFQSYVFQNCPDAIFLNEIWLEKSINSKEIIPGDSYKIFRRDRSCLSHPPDPKNPKKI